jgi:hypothetical protein
VALQRRRRALISDLAVVHLVRRANGEEPFLRFLRSYRSHPASIEHELVLLMKGFESDAEAAAYRRLAGDVSSRWVSVRDEGYDLSAYMLAGRELPHERLCFVNSFSAILVDGWLELLASGLDGPGVGLVGTTGSWGSQLSHLRFNLRLGGIYSRLYEDRTRTRLCLEEATAEGGAPVLEGGDPVLPEGKIAHKLRGALRVLRRCVSFEAFPAHHVRTNGFLISRDVLRRIESGRQRDKLDAFRLESGRRSVTRQVEAMGLDGVLAGRDGRVFAEREWAESHTYWQGDQENLMISDNRTTLYRNADWELRTMLSKWAWGFAANPSGPRE